MDTMANLTVPTAPMVLPTNKSPKLETKIRLMGRKRDEGGQGRLVGSNRGVFFFFFFSFSFLSSFFLLFFASTVHSPRTTCHACNLEINALGIHRPG
jgi:hypothetical protein